MIFVAAVSLLYWLSVLALVSWTRANVLSLSSLQSKPRSMWPRVSIVIPARDEGRHIRPALEAKLNDGYPSLEVLVVDDRSTDDTADQARSLNDPRVKVTRVDTLPPDWLGKVHALQRGVDASDSEWILFSDADVHLVPGTLTRVVAWAEENEVDFVSALPSMQSKDPWLTLTMQAFLRLILFAGRLPNVSNPKSTAAAGVGAFNLVRRSALAKSPGFEWLKMEIGDDMALGVMLKRTGAKCAFVNACDEISLEFYPSYDAMMRAVEKNGAQAPAPVMLAGLALLTFLEFGFYAAREVGVVVYFVAVITEFLVAQWLRRPLWVALLPGVGALGLNFAMARSCLLAIKRRGVVWRGTFYSTATVRAGRRL